MKSKKPVLKNPIWLLGLFSAAIISMGDGGSCSLGIKSDWTNTTYHRNDICGVNEPFYWKAKNPNVNFQIDLYLFKDTATTGPKAQEFKHIVDTSGIYKDSVLLDCRKLKFDKDELEVSEHN